jgi:hypothetical protein
MLSSALMLVRRYGTNVPFSDEWKVIPGLTGDWPLIGDWLWAQYNEHRIPLSLLTYVLLFRATGCSFQAVMVINVCAMGALALALIWASRRLRGRTSYADAFFPVALLNWSQWAIFLHAWGVSFILPAVLTGMMLILLARRGNQVTLGTATRASACLVLLVLCGPAGIALVPALIVLFGCWGVTRWRSGQPGGKWEGAAILASALPPLLLLVLWSVTREKASLWYTPVPTGPRDYARSAAQFLTVSFGHGAAQRLWPISGLVMAALLLASVAALAVTTLRQPKERFRALGFLLLLGGLVCLALGVGYGRAGAGYFGVFESRYTTLALPLLCAIFFVWGLPGMRGGRWVQAGLLALLCALLPLNLRHSLAESARHREYQRAFEQAIQGGVPPSGLIELHGPHFVYRLFIPGKKRSGPDYLAERNDVVEKMRLLRRAGTGPFPALQEAPLLREVRLPVASAALKGMSWDGGNLRYAGERPALTFRLNGPRFVSAVRVTYASENPQPPEVPFRVFWSDGDGARPAGEEHEGRLRLGTSHPSHTAWMEPTGGWRVTVWVNREIGRLGLDFPDEAGTLKILEVVLLVPDTGQPKP